AVGLLSMFVVSAVNQSSLPRSLQQQVNLDNIDFITNDQLDDVLSQTTATPEQVAQAVTINETARLRSLRASFLILAALALLAIFPAMGLPDYTTEEDPPPQTEKKPRSRTRKKTATG
ncbi:MAG: MFS transporter, partial [Anaerolineae bacterium]